MSRKQPNPEPTFKKPPPPPPPAIDTKKTIYMADILAPKHMGMKVSAGGVLGRIRDNWEVDESLRYACGELLNHLEELGERFYDGDVKVVDEFLQLYSLDKHRKN